MAHPDAWFVPEEGAPAHMSEHGERERVLFESCPLPLWIFDLESQSISHANSAACRKYGYTRDEFAGLTLRDFQPDDALGEATNPLGLEALDVFVEGCWRHRRKDGSVIHVEVSANDMEFMGRRCRFVCPNDVTERLQSEAKLRERKAALRRAQKMAQLAHNISGPGGVFESWGETLPQLVGMSEEQMPKTARDWLPLVHPGDRERFRRELVVAARSGRHCELEFRLVRADGETIHVREVIEPIDDLPGQRRGRWFCTLQDITEQKRSEELIRRANEELEARVQERTMQLQISNCELAFATAAAERANRSKSEFLSNMSHELRTPLNAIVGFGQLLAMPGLMERDEAQRNGFIEHIVDGGRHLLTLINEILNLAQIEAGKVDVQIERVALGPLLAECDAMVDPLAAKRDITMRFPMRCNEFVQADRMRLKQVMLNLVSNAIKYNRPGGEVRIDCELRDNAVRINVRDTGLGLDEVQVASLFEAFNRLGQDTSSEEGSGIGLVVTKRLVELMGGRIGVVSEPGVGSVFHVELPAVAAGRAAARGGFRRRRQRVDARALRRDGSRAPAADRPGRRRGHHPVRGRRRRQPAPAAASARHAARRPSADRVQRPPRRGDGAGARAHARDHGQQHARDDRPRSAGTPARRPGHGQHAGHRGERQRHARRGPRRPGGGLLPLPHEAVRRGGPAASGGRRARARRAPRPFADGYRAERRRRHNQRSAHAIGSSTTSHGIA